MFDLEWDLLVVLDAARPDMLRSVAGDTQPTYPYLERVDTTRSVASYSKAWMERNFDSDRWPAVERAAYVTANPFTARTESANSFGTLDEVWRYAWDEDAGTVPARPVTDRAIHTCRSDGTEQTIVHYMQPHFPSVPDPVGSGIDLDTFGEGWESAFDDLRTGRLSRERVWASAVANLRYVLDDVSLLLRSVDADDVVITADHGNAFGEWGVYGHPPGVPIQALREVPLVRTTASDNGEYEPTVDPGTSDDVDDGVERRLRDLGYA